ncbi:MAG: hypothetical protein KJO17_05740 [Acidimicrobiia bacterium]|nr:hypothetical protein [Acidimicrobiia bacterium]
MTSDMPGLGPTLTPLEIATATVAGRDEDRPSLPPTPAGMTARAALENAVLPAVARPPCVVTFSGGRDSSLVLAAAAAVARREGLPLPVPVTIDFVGIESADESKWQHLVLDHLGISEWERRPITNELDRLGPIATRALTRHGVLWPLNCYVHEAVIDRATGGSLMTGMFGDSLFGGGRWGRANQVLAGRARPGARDVLRVGLAFAPRAVRREVARRRVQDMPWLRPEAHREFEQAIAEAQASIPVRWTDWIDWYFRRRSMTVSNQSMQAIGGGAGALVIQPLSDPGLLAAMRDAGSARGFGTRTDAMRALFTELLPDPVLAREDKAVFADAFRGEASREFARTWNGEGVDSDIVDVEALAELWRSDSIHGRTTLLLHQAWLHANT